MFRLFRGRKSSQKLKPTGTLGVFVVLAFLIGGVLFSQSAGAAFYEWEQLALNPFQVGGIPYVIQEFEEFGGRLYAGTYPDVAYVWSSTDGVAWGAPLIAADFGYPDNVGICALREYSGYLYVGTCSDTLGAQLWRSNDGTTWSAVIATGEPTATAGDGFGDLNNKNIHDLEEFGGYLYAGVSNEVDPGAEVWRTNDGTTWSAVIATGEPGATAGNGFGDGGNTFVWTLEEFDGALYAGTENAAGSEMWRTTDGTSWTLANSNGYGVAANTRTLTLTSFAGSIYAGTWNASNSYIYSSSNGTSWSASDSSGFGDSNNKSIFAATEYRNELFVGTYNLNTGAEIWKTGDGALWEQVNANGFSTANNQSANAMQVIGDTLFVGNYNSGNSTDIRGENPSVVSSVTGSQATDGSGQVSVQFTVDDDEDADEVSARVEYNIGGGWQKATLSSATAAAGSPQVDNSEYYQIGTATGYIDTSGGANQLTAIWESQTDEPTADTASALVRVVASDNITEGDYAQSAAFDLDNVAPTVSANPPGGNYSSAQSVTLSANESPVTIYYTDDGSTPTATSSTYSSAISVSALGTTVLKFYAVDDKGNQSSVGTETYVISSAAASITLTKSATSSAAPAKTAASSDNRQIAAAGMLFGKIGGFLQGNISGQHNPWQVKLIEINLLILIISLGIVFFVLRLPWPEKTLVRLPVPRVIFSILFVIGLSFFASLSVLSNVKQTQAASTDVNPGDYITYRLDYSNVGGGNAYDMYILDALPIYTSYVPGTLDLNGTIKTDQLDTDEADFNDTNANKARFHIGTVTVGSSGYVSFGVKVNDNAPMGAVIANQGVGAFNPGNTSFQSNTVQNTVIATGLISGFVFYDANNNGTRDGGDFGISGASVKLYEDVDKNGVLDTSQDKFVHSKSSASNGSYDFTGLSARFYLINVEGLHSSYKLTTGNMPGQAVLATSFQQYTGANFGFYVQPQLPVTPPIVGGKDDGSDKVTIKLPVDKVTDYVEDIIPDKKEPEKEKRPDKLEETDNLRRPQEKETDKTGPIVIQEVSSWWDKLKDINKKFVAPILFAFTLLNFLLGVPLSIALSYLHYLTQLFTEPLLFFGRKRREWGVVYNSLTKQPLDLAMVRLFDQETNKLVETRVTDKAGRFLFIVEPEKSYYITADKPYYNFPSRYSMGRKSDANYHNLYHGQLISASTSQEMKKTGHIAVNIPLDPQEGYIFNQAHPGRPIKTPIGNLREAATLPAQRVVRDDQRVLRSSWWRRVNQVAAYIGPVLGLVSFVITPTLLTFIFLLLHIFLLILFHRLALGKLSKPWGKVFDAADEKPLSRSVIRLFDSKYGRLLLTTVSKGDGRYGFLIGNEMYSLIPFKDGYKFPPQRIEILGNKEQVVRKDLGMEKDDANIRMHTNDTNK